MALLVSLPRAWVFSKDCPPGQDPRPPGLGTALLTATWSFSASPCEMPSVSMRTRRPLRSSRSSCPAQLSPVGMLLGLSGHRLPAQRECPAQWAVLGPGSRPGRSQGSIPLPSFSQSSAAWAPTSANRCFVSFVQFSRCLQWMVGPGPAGRSCRLLSSTQQVTQRWSFSHCDDVSPGLQATRPEVRH